MRLWSIFVRLHNRSCADRRGNQGLAACRTGDGTDTPTILLHTRMDMAGSLACRAVQDSVLANPSAARKGMQDSDMASLSRAGRGKQGLDMDNPRPVGTGTQDPDMASPSRACRGMQDLNMANRKGCGPNNRVRLPAAAS